MVYTYGIIILLLWIIDIFGDQGVGWVYIRILLGIGILWLLFYLGSFSCWGLESGF